MIEKSYFVQPYVWGERAVNLVADELVEFEK